jgi:microcystin-dependent protein
MPAQPFVGQIAVFPFSIVPSTWALCSGQLLAVIPPDVGPPPTTGQNTALFSLLGHAYGGSEGPPITMALPDLRGRTPIHQGQGAGLSNRAVGQSGGQAQVALDEDELPAHTHAMHAATGEPTTNMPGSSVLPSKGGAYGAADGALMNEDAVTTAGGSQPHENMPPYMVMNYCIALAGVFPPRD